MKKEKSKKEKQEYKIHETQDWIYALKLAFIIFIVVVYYHYVRRDIFLPFFSETDVNFLYLANKGVSITAIVMIAISTIIGPLTEFFPSFGKKIRYRKEIGIVGFYLAIPHIIISFLFLPWKFDITWFQNHQTSVTWGALAFIIFIIITIFSNKHHLISFGYKKWKLIQRLVYIGMLFTASHIIALGKVAGWKKWWANPSATHYLPPGTLITIIVIGFAFLLRFIVLLKNKK